MSRVTRHDFYYLRSRPPRIKLILMTQVAILIRKGLFWLLLPPLLFFSSCNNEIDLEVSGDPVPVVYCLLNPDQEHQFVRLGRSYLPDPGNPEKPPLADSTVWNMDIEIYLEEWLGGSPARTVNFEPWIGAVKDSGFFPSDNLRIFHAAFKPSIFTSYRLYVHFPDDNRIISANTTIPGRPVIYDPMELPGRKINLQSEVQYTIRWLTAEGAGIYQGYFDLFYEEQYQGNTSLNEIVFDSEPVLNLVPGAEDSKKILSGASFFDQIARKVPVREGAIRKVVNFRFRFFAGGEELGLYASPDLRNTTISNNLNQYTNFDNGIGLFSSLQILYVNNLQLSNTTINQLAHGGKTGHLGFRDVFDGIVKN